MHPDHPPSPHATTADDEYNPYRCEVCGKLNVKHFDLCPACRADPYNADYVSGRKFRSTFYENAEGEELERDTFERTATWQLRPSTIATTREACLALRERHPDWSARRIASELGIAARTAQEHLASPIQNLGPVQYVALKPDERDALLLAAWREHLTSLQGDELEEALADPTFRETVEVGEVLAGYFIPAGFVAELGLARVAWVPEPKALAVRNARVRDVQEASEAREDQRRARRTAQQRARRDSKKGK